MNELATIESGPLTMVQVVAQKRLIQEVMKAVMKENTHYGVIPGCKLPSLYKAGSEAILSTFRIAVDPSVEDLSVYDCFRYRVTLRGIIPTGEIVGAGIGECSTDEEKYKWRGIVCDAEYDNTPEDRRRIKYAKPTSWNNGGVVKQVRTNPSDLANTVLKMAKKRAQIDLTLTATGASDCFAQDIEDLPEEIRDEMARDAIISNGKPSVASPTTKAAPTGQAADNGEKATDGQVKILGVKLRQAGIKEPDFCAHYKISIMADLPKSAVNGAIKAIGEGEIKPAKTVEPVKEDAGKEEGTITLEACKNCGEMIDEDGKGHHADCPNGEA